MTDPLLVDIRDGIAELTLNRPDAANAIDLPAARQWLSTVSNLAAGSQVRAVLISGAGGRFCAGGDVVTIAGADDRSWYVAELADTLDRALVALAELPVPVVAAVHGAVAGAGLGLMLSCDLVVAAASTRFTAGYPGVGLNPDCGVSWLLPRAVGQQRALQFLLSSVVLSAAEALDWGMVGEVVGDDAVMTRGREIARRLADGPSGALGQTRRLVRAGWQLDRAAAGRRETAAIAAAVVTGEAAERLRRFTSG